MDRQSEIAAERAVHGLLLGAASLTVLVTLALVGTLAYEAVRFLSDVSPARVFGDIAWAPLFEPSMWGIAPLVMGTLLVTGVALLVAVPLGLLSAIHLSELAGARQRRWLKPTLELVAGLPTIVLGYFALLYVSPALQALAPGLPAQNALVAGLVVGLLVVPTFATLTDDALQTVPDALREAALGLGASRGSTVFRVVLPAARSGIAAAALLAMARAAGETMIVTLVAGQRAQLTFAPTDPVQTMTGWLAQVSLGEVPPGSDAWRSLFLVGGALFVLSFALNGLARWLLRGART